MSQPTPPPYEGQQPGSQQPGSQQPYSQQPYSQPATAYPQQGYGYQPSSSTNSMALISLIAAIAGVSILPFVGSIVAVITGPMANKQIAQTGEQGAGMAKAGIIIGWVGIALGIIGIVALIAFWGVVATTAVTTS